MIKEHSLLALANKAIDLSELITKLENSVNNIPNQTAEYLNTFSPLFKENKQLNFLLEEIKKGTSTGTERPFASIKLSQLESFLTRLDRLTESLLNSVDFVLTADITNAPSNKKLLHQAVHINSAVHGLIGAVEREKTLLDSEKELDKNHNFIEAMKRETKSLIEQNQDFYSKSERRLKSLVNECSEKGDVFKSQIDEYQQLLKDLETKSSKMFDATEKKMQSIDNESSESLNYLKVKKSEMDELLDTVGKKATASEFLQSSKEEKKLADLTRIGALICMALVIIIIFVNVYVNSQHEMVAWTDSLFSAFLIFSLSVPAVYLSRESSKHRAKHYEYGQTAFKINALPLYVAKLPEDIQIEIKKLFAESVFRAEQSESQESYPINLQEFMLEILKVLNAKKQ
ncbi:hypothetical protein [Pseudoalteromonas maricaloris]|uniref:hypothetical protein n=1 Tax=Pseudoalteromonas maricaloris TaxID=184924 RepID=UPI00029A615B|nr:hypothetical protein [Pseudoalteromonas flavipulchra]